MLDVIVHPIEVWPSPGQLVLCEHGMLVPGGVALNTAVTVARLGGNAGLIAGLGQDAAGRAVRQVLAREGVNASKIITLRDRSTGFCIVGIDKSSERSLVAHVGANAHLHPEHVDWAGVEAGDYLHVGGCFAMPNLRGDFLSTLIDIATERGLRVSLESAWDVTGTWLRGAEGAIAAVDVFMASEQEATGMTGIEDPEAACAALGAYGPQVVVVKAGERGAFVWKGGSVTHYAGHVVELVDATGAGDTFCGGLLFALSQGWDIERAVRLANAVGAMNVTAVGATGGVRDLPTTLAFMRAQGDQG
ncbi:MAG: carbohydrate kinase family protein [Actinobacteria bacterium]|nr:carbohydrate kinase family protein [Actinomycetota bacterium]